MLSEIESALLHDYYDTERVTEDMSSHWSKFSADFQVRVDEEGCLQLAGSGFGAGRYSSVGHHVLDLLTRLAHLVHLRRRSRLVGLMRQASRLARAAGLDPTFDVFRQVCTLAEIEHALGSGRSPRRILIIGDGFGVLASLVKHVYPYAQIVLVDLGRTLLFQAHHIRRAWPDAQHSLAQAGDEIPPADFVYCPSDRLELLSKMRFDLAVNVASMQEMAPEIIAHYFRFLRRHLLPSNLFYCCNRERKTLIGGEVSEFLRYPWREKDRIWFDGQCPWHQYFFGFGRTLRGPRFLGIRLPLIHYYDGPHRHRLATLETE